MSEAWTLVSDALPTSHKVVETKIDDANGKRNEAKLKRIGRLWWTADGAMYVYYTPTHWRPLSSAKDAQ